MRGKASGRDCVKEAKWRESKGRDSGCKMEPLGFQLGESMSEIYISHNFAFLSSCKLCFDWG